MCTKQLAALLTHDIVFVPRLIFFATNTSLKLISKQQAQKKKKKLNHENYFWTQTKGMLDRQIVFFFFKGGWSIQTSSFPCVRLIHACLQLARYI